jgi:hypothetical protein
MMRRLVLGGAAAVEPGRVLNARCVRVAGQTYPMLRPAATGAVDGVLARLADAEALRRLLVYEGVAYRLARLAVVGAEGRVVPALAFLPSGRMARRFAPWRYADWVRRWRRAALREVERFLACPQTRAQIRGLRHWAAKSTPRSSTLHGRCDRASL